MPARLPPDPDAVPLGATLTPDRAGATFRCWAPKATAVWVRGDFNNWAADDKSLLNQHGDYWVGFLPGAKDGQSYKFYVDGEQGPEWKRDPYARELTKNPAYPTCHCVLRDPAAYAWADDDFRVPAFNDLILYQLHVGTFNGPDRENRVAKFLDVLGKLDHLVALGVNGVQLLPIVEFASPRSRGYEGSDIFSPEMDYAVDPAELPGYLPLVNGLRARYGLPPHSVASLTPQGHQLRAMVELFHLAGVAVLFDVVYNHAGGQVKGQRESLWNFDRRTMESDNDSQYFTDRDWTGPVWALWDAPVRQLLIDNALAFVREYRVDGFRYDETSAIVRENTHHGWEFCQRITGKVRHADPTVIQIAEYWDPGPNGWVVKPDAMGGAGFDACWHDALRDAVRDAVRQASFGMDAAVDLDKIAVSLWPGGFEDAWRCVQCLENHDEVYAGRGPRIPRLADAADPRSWYARSRSRVATGLLLTAPGVPLLFMGQEMLEDKQWTDNPGGSSAHLLWWDGLDYGKDRVMVDFHRFVTELIAVRRSHPALRGNRLNVFHRWAPTRVLAFHRWLDGDGQDVVVVVSLNDNAFPAYDLGWPAAGEWREVFNSDAYDAYAPTGNGGRIEASPEGRDGMSASARIVIPANAVLVFAR